MSENNYNDTSDFSDEKIEILQHMLSNTNDMLSSMKSSSRALDKTVDSVSRINSQITSFSTLYEKDTKKINKLLSFAKQKLINIGRGSYVLVGNPTPQGNNQPKENTTWPPI